MSATLLGSEDYVAALVRAIASARIEVLLESYIFANDASGTLVWQHLLAAAERGVRVRVLLDGHGSHDFSASWAQALAAVGGQLLFFRPRHRDWLLKRRSLRRMHRKLVSIDGELAFCGGINIYDAQVHGANRPRFDFAVAVQGPAVSEVRQSMLRMWRHVSWAHLQAALLPPLPIPPADGDSSITLVTRDNVMHRHAIEACYLVAIRNAQRRILIANAYFLPGYRFRRALAHVVARGVEVKLLLPGRNDHPLAHLASRALYPELLRQGIQLFEYQPAQLHAKVMVVDDDWLTVGSSNIDPLSLLLAREANLVIEDTALAAQLAQTIELAMDEDSVAVLANAPLVHGWRRILQLLSYGWVRFLLAFIPASEPRRY